MALSTSLPEGWVAAWVLFVGAAVGSFLNVVVARLPRGQSIVRPRSRCPRCGAGIAWYDNVPIVSWVLLRARCRACSAPISARYPLVEALGAGAAFLAWTRHGLTPAAVAELALAAALLALSFIDLDTWLLPNAITWPLAATGVAASALGLSGAPGLRSSLYGAGVGFAAFAVVAAVGAKVFRREALGFGDVWLLAGLGAWLGVGALLPVVLLASVQGSAVGIALILLGRATPGPKEKGRPLTPTLSPQSGEREKGTPNDGAAERTSLSPTGGEGKGEGAALDDDWVPPKNAVPFGPFLAAAALEWLYLSGPLVRWIPALEIFR